MKIILQQAEVRKEQLAWEIYNFSFCVSHLLYFTKKNLGYERQYRGLRDYLSSQPFADKINVVALKDTAITGNFEVTVKQTGQVLHSKRTKGKGKAESSSERNAIAVQIEDLLEE